MAKCQNAPAGGAMSELELAAQQAIAAAGRRRHGRPTQRARAMSTTDEDNYRIEVWDSEESHAAAVKTPVVQRAIVDAKPMVAGFEKVATTRPVRGVR